jgi:hypothetical protein
MIFWGQMFAIFFVLIPKMLFQQKVERKTLIPPKISDYFFGLR